MENRLLVICVTTLLAASPAAAIAQDMKRVNVSAGGGFTSQTLRDGTIGERL